MVHINGENQANDCLMLTTDLAFILVNDSDYLDIVTQYTTNILSLNTLVMSGGYMISNYFCVDRSSININLTNGTMTRTQAEMRIQWLVLIVKWK